MSGITIYEYDVFGLDGIAYSHIDGIKTVPASVFEWLGEQCLKNADAGDAIWIRWTQRRGHRVFQVTSFVGVIRSPDGFQIEVLPKVGKAIEGGIPEARQLLIEMLCCMRDFRHVLTERAMLSAARMPVLEIFISEFLYSVQNILKQGLRIDYRQRQDNVFALRGKLMTATHLRQNIHRADRFFTEHDEFSTDRPENRLLHAALIRVLHMTRTQANQRLARELSFVFSDIPPSTQTTADFQRVRLDRGMNNYVDALDWASLILNEQSPVTGLGQHGAPSLLFPMEAVFEAFVAKYLRHQLPTSLDLKTQAQTQHLVVHCDHNWFKLKPDLLIQKSGKNLLVLDTKWKLLDSLGANGTDKYGLSQGDFYQLQAYGLSYLDGQGDVVLIYPKTDSFSEPLPVFQFSKLNDMRLWVLPFCLKERKLNLPISGEVNANLKV